MSDIKEYTNGEVTIIWEAEKCYHSKNCVNNLPQVFDPGQRPWIKPEEASSAEIVATVKKCPSGALTYRWNDEEQEAEHQKQMSEKNTKIEIKSTGPIIVKGAFEVHDDEGNVIDCKEQAAFCRCGQTGNQPFCDGSHNRVGFKGVKE